MAPLPNRTAERVEGIDDKGKPRPPLRYKKEFIPKTLFDTLPKLPRGRPSRAKVKERQDLIDQYWSSR